jgi:hypothetical protein
VRDWKSTELWSSLFAWPCSSGWANRLVIERKRQYV